MNTEQIISRLRAADRAWQKERAAVLLLRWFKWPVIAFATLITADVIWHLRAEDRLMLGVAFLVAVAGGLAWLGWFALLKVNPPERIARLLESRSPDLGSKLINLLHLRETFLVQPHASALTRSLAAQAVDDAAAGVGTTPLRPLTKEPDRRRLVWHLVVPLFSLLVLSAVFFVPLVTTLVRFLDPRGDHPPYSLTRLWIEEPGGDKTSVLYGANFMVKVRWAGHDPKELMLSAFDPLHPESVTTVPMMPQEPGLFAQQIENVRTDLVLRAHTPGGWSTSHERRLSVVLTPQFERAVITITPPEYTGLREKSATFTFKGATALKGSRVRVTLESNRPLQDGHIKLTTASGKVQDIELPVADAVTKPREVTGSFIAEDSGRMIFAMKDVAGIPSDEERSSAFTVTHDLPPTVSIPQPPRDGYLVEGFPMTGRSTAADDYGLKTVRVHVMRFDDALKPVERNYKKITLNDTVELPLTELFTPPLKAGEQISFFAEAIDTHPTPPHVARSEIRRLAVISKLEYNDFLRTEHTIADLEKKYDDLFDGLRQLLEQQKQLADEAATLDDKLAENPDDKTLQEQRDKQKQQQAKLNAELNKSADEMEEFVTDTPLYDVEKDFADMLKEQARQVRESVAKNEQDMKQGDPKKMSDAAKEHHERMAGQQKQTEEQIEKAIADASEMQEMMDDFNSFAALHEAQELLTQQAGAYRDKRQLDDNDKVALQSLGATQREIRDELRDLQQKLEADAKKHAEKYPKASASCQKLADAMGELRMEQLAAAATGKMVQGDSQGGYFGADRLRAAMASLIGQCNGGKGESSSELDRQLALSQCKKPGATGKQMLMSRKFGKGRGMSGRGGGLGGMMNGDDASGGESVYGMESKLGRLKKSGPGEGEAPPSPAEGAAPSVTSTTINDSPGQVNRAGEATPATTVLEQYRNLTDAYFDKITGKAKKEEPKP